MESRRLQELLKVIRRISVFAEITVGILMLVYVSCTVPNLLLLIFEKSSVFASNDGGFIISLFPQLFSIVGTLLIFIALITFFRSVRIGRSPFTVVQVRKFQIIAAILAISFVIKIFASQTILPYTHIGSFTVSVVGASADPAVLDINLSYLLWSVISFFISNVLKYGAALQSISDDTA